jgi:phosphorylated CTD-interacting factor 1
MCEDTPSIALKRRDVVRGLRVLLLQETQRCALIQKEPDNALARFLFSGITLCGDARSDPLLPSIDFKDRSIMKELTSTKDGRRAYTELQAENVCDKLCKASQKGIQAVQAVRTHAGSVTRAFVDHFQVKLMYNRDSICISKFHYTRLHDMYAMHSGDGGKKDFLTRLYCLLLRYATLGGPMYQCSCTGAAFDAMRRNFEVRYECFASPFNHNAGTYWSAFPDTDRFFGSKGSFFTHVDDLEEQGGSFYANPPFVEDVMLLMQGQMQKMLAWTAPVSFVVVIPHWMDEPCHVWLMGETAAGKAKHIALPRGHHYVEGNQQSNTRQVPKEHTSRFEASLFLIQNEAGQKQWPDADADADGRKFSKLQEIFDMFVRDTGALLDRLQGVYAE